MSPRIRVPHATVVLITLLMLTLTGFFGEVDFVDSFQLCPVEGEWKILSKSFATM